VYTVDVVEEIIAVEVARDVDIVIEGLVTLPELLLVGVELLVAEVDTPMMLLVEVGLLLDDVELLGVVELLPEVVPVLDDVEELLVVGVLLVDDVVEELDVVEVLLVDEVDIKQEHAELTAFGLPLQFSR